MGPTHGCESRVLSPAFAWAVGINAAYVVVEAAFGILTGSLALLADAAHNLTDVGGLLLAWGAAALGRRRPSEQVQAWLTEQPGVVSDRDLHIWAMSTTSAALTVHMVMPGGSPGDTFLDAVSEGLQHRFGIEHATLQIERGDGPECRLSPDSIV